MKDNQFNHLARQCSLPYPTDNVNLIYNNAYELFTKHYKWEHPLRSLGIRTDNLLSCEHEQLTFFNDDDCEINIELDNRIKSLLSRFSNIAMEKTSMSKEW